MVEWVDVTVPEEWATAGQSRPALLLRENTEPDPDPAKARQGATVTTYDVTAFLHPEDRQSRMADTWLRLPEDRITRQEKAAASTTDGRSEEGPYDPGAPPPPEPQGLQAGRSEAERNDVPRRP